MNWYGYCVVHKCGNRSEQGMRKGRGTSEIKGRGKMTGRGRGRDEGLWTRKEREREK